MATAVETALGSIAPTELAQPEARADRDAVAGGAGELAAPPGRCAPPRLRAPASCHP